MRNRKLVIQIDRERATMVVWDMTCNFFFSGQLRSDGTSLLCRFCTHRGDFSLEFASVNSYSNFQDLRVKHVVFTEAFWSVCAWEQGWHQHFCLCCRFLSRAGHPLQVAQQPWTWAQARAVSTPSGPQCQSFATP